MGDSIGNANEVDYVGATMGNSISTSFTAFDEIDKKNYSYINSNNYNNNNNNNNNNTNNNKDERSHNGAGRLKNRRRRTKKHQLEQLNIAGVHQVERIQQEQQLREEGQEQKVEEENEDLLSVSLTEDEGDCSLSLLPAFTEVTKFCTCVKPSLFSLEELEEVQQQQDKPSEKKINMVLPFDLGPDGRNVNAIQSAEIVPSAPPARFSVPPQYPRGQTTIYTGVPIILNPYIDFIVVNGDDRYMIRCERKSVLERSVELAKLIHAGPNSGRKGDNHFQVLNVDKNDFELIIRYMETRFIRYRDHKHLLKLLELADRFNVPDLIIYCIRELDLNITSATVLDVFKALWFYQAITLTNQHHTVITTEKSTTAAKKKAAKSLKTSSSNSTTVSVNGTTANSENNGGKASAAAASATATATNQPIPNPNPFTTEDYGVALLHNALQLIDMHAELILGKEEISGLRFEELETIVKRNSLQLRTEVTLFECLADWSLADCRRKNLDATPENRRRVLGPLCLMPRYLLMTKSEFQKCCDRIDLLPPMEIALISECLDGKKPKNCTDQQRDLLEKFRTPRAEYAKMPVHLSDRSHPQNYPKKMRLAHEGRPTEEGCWEKIGMNCLRVIACIFD